MSLHKIQIFSFITFTLVVFGVTMSAIADTFKNNCALSGGIPNSTISQSGSYNITSGTISGCGTFLNSFTLTIIGILVTVAGICLLPFI